MFRAGVLGSEAYLRARERPAGLRRPGDPGLVDLTEVWADALAFSLSLMAILFAHEMGHYLTARRLGVKMSPPYFLPWFEPFGSMGAVIAMEARPMSARQRAGRSGGPFAGMIVAVPLIVIGAMWSGRRSLRAVVRSSSESACSLGGWSTSSSPRRRQADVFLHPMAFAGWAAASSPRSTSCPSPNSTAGTSCTAFGERSAGVRASRSVR